MTPIDEDKLRYCVSCTLKIEVQLGTWIGVSPFNTKCVHLSTGSSCKLAVSGFYLTISALVAIFILIDTIYNIYLLVNIYAVVDTLKSYQLLTDIILEVKSNSIIILSMIYIKYGAEHYSGFIEMLEKCNSFGVEQILEEKSKRTLRLLSVVGYGVIIFLTVGEGLYLYSTNHFDSAYICIKTAVSVICFYVDVSVLYQFTVKIALYSMIFQGSHSNIKRSMMIYQDGNFLEKLNDYRDRIEMTSLLKFLSQMHRLHLAVAQNFKFLSKQFNPLTLLWILLTIAAAVVNIYIFLRAWETGNGDLLGFTDLCMQARLMGSVLFMYQEMNLIEDLGKVNEDILSFLFKYPISKLSIAEAAQVEMLITTLNIQKPVIRGSDMFTVGTRTLASMLGTVVTYVLVALQFHAPWVKE